MTKDLFHLVEKNPLVMTAKREVIICRSLTAVIISRSKPLVEFLFALHVWWHRSSIIYWFVIAIVLRIHAIWGSCGYMDGKFIIQPFEWFFCFFAQFNRDSHSLSGLRVSLEIVPVQRKRIMNRTEHRHKISHIYAMNNPNTNC